MSPLIIVFLVLALLGVLLFFVLPAKWAPFGWVLFGAAVLGMLITMTVEESKAGTIRFHSMDSVWKPADVR